MKKSEIFKYSQFAVLECNGITKCMKLEILRQLMAEEDLAKFTEDLEAKEAAKNEAV